ncbi:hypothetical protein [Bacillus subtilis]|uniref:hypothetical protein n=1 Tax=Bacillus subtilis TaxID=1423 RepID=UPI0016429E26|nr:hypothetical protein [Bacillus subtilis]
MVEMRANGIIEKMREEVFWEIEKMGIGYFEKVGGGKVVGGIRNDREGIRDLYVRVV